MYIQRERDETGLSVAIFIPNTVLLFLRNDVRGGFELSEGNVRTLLRCGVLLCIVLRAAGMVLVTLCGGESLFGPLSAELCSVGCWVEQVPLCEGGGS